MALLPDTFLLVNGIWGDLKIEPTAVDADLFAEPWTDRINWQDQLSITLDRAILLIPEESGSLEQ